MVLRVVDLGSLLFWVNKRTRCQLGWVGSLELGRKGHVQASFDWIVVLSFQSFWCQPPNAKLTPFTETGPWAFHHGNYLLRNLLQRFLLTSIIDPPRNTIYFAPAYTVYIYICWYITIKKKKCTVKGYIVYNATIHIDVIKNMIIVAF
jgi:hypothetical protein